jgi:CheY-like chemotaxis protein
MTGVTLPVTRPTGRSLLIGGPATGAEAGETLRKLGYNCVEIEDPYAAMAMLSEQPLAYSSVVLSLNTLFRDELQIIAAVKQRFAHIEIWLARFEGRQSVVDEALRLGADGFLDADGLHRVAAAVQAPVIEKQNVPQPAAIQELPPEPAFSDPVLSAEELRALLDDQPDFGDAKQA